MAGVDECLAQVARCSGLDLSGVGRISPPWTYQLLAVICWLLLAGETTWWLIGLAG
jgi:hypothetical protein